MFAEHFGDLERGRRAFGYSRQLAADASHREKECTSVQNLARIEFLIGRFRRSLEYSESANSLAVKANAEAAMSHALTSRATALFALGDVGPALRDFEKATELQHEPLYGLSGIEEAECKLLRGDSLEGRHQTQVNRVTAITEHWNDELCRSNALLARFLLQEDPAEANQRLLEARAFANRSGYVELQLRCFHAACELHLHLADYRQAIAEAEGGILLADTCGFGKFSIDLRVALAETLLAAGGDARKALQNARDALDRSGQPNCAYAWGQADGLHFCGLAHLRLGERELARQRLTAALKLRKRLGHGRIEETRRALDLCRP